MVLAFLRELTIELQSCKPARSHKNAKGLTRQWWILVADDGVADFLKVEYLIMTVCLSVCPSVLTPFFPFPPSSLISLIHR
jgi:hypothetical protein